jgi:hypothetical protein
MWITCSHRQAAMAAVQLRLMEDRQAAMAAVQ